MPPTTLAAPTLVTALGDWKKEGAFIGFEYRLQVGAYWGATHLYDKVNNLIDPHVQEDVAFVAWVGPNGVKIKLVLDRAALEAAFASFQHALALYREQVKHDPQVAKGQGRYEDPLNPGKKLISVTQVLQYVCGKPGLMNWYCEAGAEAAYATVHQKLVTEADLEQGLAAKARINAKTLRRDHDDALPWKHLLKRMEDTKLTPISRRDAAGDWGSLIHKNLMFYLQGKAVDLTEAPAPLVSCMARFGAWTGRFRVEPTHLEQQVFHPVLGYAGTLDARVRMDAAALSTLTTEEESA